MTMPALFLLPPLPPVDAPPPGQLVLRPRAVLWEAELETPSRAYLACGRRRPRPPKGRTMRTLKPWRAPPAPKEVAEPVPSDPSAPLLWDPSQDDYVPRPVRARSQAPRRRRAGARPFSIGARRLTDAERQGLRADRRSLAVSGVRLGPPKTFGDCTSGPCPHVSCRHHLYLDVVPPRRYRSLPTIKVNFPHLNPGDIPETCSLRAANAGGATLEEVGKRANLTEARAEQVEKQALAKIRAFAEQHGWDWRDLYRALMNLPG